MESFINRIIEKIDRIDGEALRSIINSIKRRDEIFYFVLNNVDIGIMVLESDMTIIFANDRIKEILECFSIESGKNILKVNIDVVLRDLIIEHIREKKEYRADIEISFPSSRYLYVSILAFMEYDVYVVLIMDKTECIKQQLELKQAKSLAALTTLAAGVAHEIKNPLGAIMIYIQLIEREVSSLHNDKLINFINIVKDEINRLDNIVKGFLFTARPIKLNTERQSLKNVVYEVIGIVDKMLEGKDIKFNIDIADNIVAEIDKDYFKQVLINLIKNAIESIDSKGYIEIKAFYDGDDVIIRIFDNGKGIEPDNIPKIFEPYFTTKDNGTGIGLTIVYKIVKMHRGNISVKSKKGEGTTFEIIIPQTQKPRGLVYKKE